MGMHTQINPFKAVAAVPLAAHAQILGFCAIIELASIEDLYTAEKPWDLGFDPMNFSKNKTPEQIEEWTFSYDCYDWTLHTNCYFWKSFILKRREKLCYAYEAENKPEITKKTNKQKNEQKQKKEKRKSKSRKKKKKKKKKK